MDATIVAAIVAIVLPTLAYVLFTALRQDQRIKSLERRSTCAHCTHWMMTTPRRTRVYQHCCWCGAVLAINGDEQAHGARRHGPYLLLSPGYGTRLTHTPKDDGENPDRHTKPA